MQLSLEQYEKIAPFAEVEFSGVRMRFATPSVVTMARVQTIGTKEPWTLEWIATFREGEVLVDCGANVGMYTIWAAATRRASVYAFEPEAQNYAVLNRNVQLNDLGDRVRAYCLGLSDAAGLSVLHLSEVRAGGSNHSVGEALDFEHKPMRPAFVQGCVTQTLDALVASGEIPEPHHIKVDVDGFESKVIAGARGTLARKSLRSLLIETNPSLDDHRAMVAELERQGFRYDPAQVERARRKSGPFTGVAEYVFAR